MYYIKGKLDQGEIKQCQDKDFPWRSAKTLTFGIETWFIVIASLPPSSLLVKCEQDGAEENEIMMQSWISQRSAITFFFDLTTF